MNSTKTEFPGIRKVKEGILLNTDNTALAAYKNKKLREKKIDMLGEEVENIKKDLDEIKELLKGLVK